MTLARRNKLLNIELALLLFVHCNKFVRSFYTKEELVLIDRMYKLRRIRRRRIWS
jgi:hypothetical protein